MIKIKGLTKTYQGNIQALRGLDLEIGSGMFGLVGPNGAGKTSLMRILAGLIQPTNGNISIFGHDVTTSEGKMAVKALLGYLPQELGLYPNLTAFEFLDYIATLKGLIHPPTRQQHIHEVLVQVHLNEVAHRPLKSYSGGMKRRVGLAQAILSQPKLVIVDEPTVGLDPEERIRIRNLLSAIAQRCTVILSTHIIEDISQSCRDLVVLHQGQIRFQGNPTDLISQALGNVWTIITETLPSDDLIVVSSRQQQTGTQYRVLSPEPPEPEAVSIEPTLEDGYMWLMQGK